MANKYLNGGGYSTSDDDSTEMVAMSSELLDESSSRRRRKRRGAHAVSINPVADVLEYTATKPPDTADVCRGPLLRWCK